MRVLANQTSPKRRLLLASDRSDYSSELAGILESVGEVDTIATSEIPDVPAGHFSGIVVDINLRSAESVQQVRNKLRGDAYLSVPRLFVLADALHHGSMQAWALGATDTIARPFDPEDILQRIRAAFPDVISFDATADGKALNRGIAAAQASYRHCLFVTGYAVAFAQHLGMRENDQRRLTRAALLHDVGKAFIPVAILDKRGQLTDEETRVMRLHPRLGYDALAAEGSFPPEMMDVILHHHEFLDGSGYPNGLRGNRISDIVRLTTIVDIHTALVEQRPYRLAFTHAKAFAIMEDMPGKLDPHLLQAFRPVALGCF